MIRLTAVTQFLWRDCLQIIPKGQGYFIYIIYVLCVQWCAGTLDSRRLYTWNSLGNRIMNSQRLNHHKTFRYSPLLNSKTRSNAYCDNYHHFSEPEVKVWLKLFFYHCSVSLLQQMTHANENNDKRHMAIATYRSNGVIKTCLDY